MAEIKKTTTNGIRPTESFEALTIIKHCDGTTTEQKCRFDSLSSHARITHVASIETKETKILEIKVVDVYRKTLYFSELSNRVILKEGTIKIALRTPAFIPQANFENSRSKN